MTIKIKSFLTLRRVMDNQACIEMTCGPVTIQELLRVLAERFGSGFKAMVFEEGSSTVGPHVRILVNGKHYGILPEKLDTILNPGDEIGLFPPIAGG